MSEIRKLHCNPYAGGWSQLFLKHQSTPFLPLPQLKRSIICLPFYNLLICSAKLEWFLLFGHRIKRPYSWVFTLLNQPLLSSPLQFLIERVYLTQPTMKIPFFSWLFLITICSLFVNFGIFVVSDQCLHDQRDS